MRSPGFQGRSHVLTPEVFGILRDLIHARLGLFFENGKTDLVADRLSPLVGGHGMGTFLDYYYLLKYDRQAGEEEWGRVAEALTINETYFWREADQVVAAVEELVPALLSALPDGRRLRIWSAACSSGEEPLSVAMALNEAGHLQGGGVEIVATDVSAKAVESAREGLYGERSFRVLPRELRGKYFTPESGKWRIDPRIHSAVKWHRANLMDSSTTAAFGCSSIVFCRNAFIYFSQDAMLRVVRSLYDHMPRPGYLFLGASESLLRLGTDFDFQRVGGVFAYVKT